jgi:hypothetical protein
MNTDIIEILFSIIVIPMAYAIGFYLIYILEKEELYNLFTAILFPLVVVFTLWLLSSLLFIEIGYLLIFLFPFLLISAVTGGIIAHRKRKQQQSIDI